MQMTDETDKHPELNEGDDSRIRWWHYLIYYPGPYRYDDYEDRTQIRWWDFIICMVCHLGIIGPYIYVSAHLGLRSEEGVSLYLILALVVVILFFVNRFILRLYLDRVRDIPLGGVLAPFADWRKSVTVYSIKRHKHSSRKEAIKSIFKPSFWLSSETSVL